MSTIITLGGGGFSMEEENTLLDSYIFSFARRDKAKVCFLGTASGDAESYSKKFFKAMEKHNVIPKELSLFSPPISPAEFEAFILDQDVIYVGGGNTFNLISLWTAWDLGAIFRKAMDEGLVLSGISAGAICWFESGVTDSFAEPGSSTLSPIKGLGFIEGSFCPHYDGEENRRPEYHRLIAAKELASGRAADDGVAIRYENGVFQEAVTSRKNRSAFGVTFEEKTVIETKIDTRYLG